MPLPHKDDWKACAAELAYALQVQLFNGHGEFVKYTIQEANEFARKALERFDRLEDQDTTGERDS